MTFARTRSSLRRRARLALVGLGVLALVATASLAASPSASAATRSIRAADLLSAPVPAECRHPAGRLRNGRLPGLTVSQGYENVATTSKGVVIAAIGDVTRDRRPDAVTYLQCSAGGVSWPDTVLLYAPGTRLLTAFDLSRLEPDAEHANVTSVKIVRGDVVVAWGTTEGCCMNPKTFVATLRWNGRTLVVRTLGQLTGVGSRASAVKAVSAWYAARRAGAVATARLYEAPEYNVPAGSSSVPTKADPPVAKFTCTLDTTTARLRPECMGMRVQKLSPGQSITFEEVTLRWVAGRWKVSYSTWVSGE